MAHFLLLTGSLLTGLLQGIGLAPHPDWNLEPILTRQESARPPADSFAARPAVQRFIRTMASEHPLAVDDLERWFGEIRSREDIIALISRPAEKTLSWGEYREIFLDQPRIDNGATFWRRHRETLQKAEQEYGVPAQVVVAILGVETRYGKVTGRHGVLEALATLAFDYPPRADFFRRELEKFLLLTREENMDPLAPKGSYAGAMGLAQFMPSSFLAYAVDFDDDGQRDIWHNPVDAIGSIANYLSEHRWRRGAPVGVPANVEGSGYRRYLSGGLEPPSASVALLRRNGVQATRTVDDQQQAFLLELSTAGGAEYWLGFYNFYVITRYNRSPLYAMAVHQLGEAISDHVR